jgi:hypothetical protein
MIDREFWASKLDDAHRENVKLQVKLSEIRSYAEELKHTDYRGNGAPEISVGYELLEILDKE